MTATSDKCLKYSLVSEDLRALLFLPSDDDFAKVLVVYMTFEIATLAELELLFYLVTVKTGTPHQPKNLSHFG